MTSSTTPVQALRDAGVAVWLDDLSRQRIASGGLADLVRRGVVGVTTNPTIFASALAHGDAYDAQLRTLAADGAAVEEAVLRITTDDVRDACDVLRPVYDATDGVDGRVSIEVDPRLARDTAATVASAETLWSEIERPNLFVKIPATREGLPAITAALAQGISVNVTLIFSLQRYRAVLDAFLDGLEQARAAGIDLAPIGSVASFFVSRVDAAIDPRLDALGTAEAAELRGTAAIANARLAWGVYQEVVAGERWQALAAAGAKPQRPLWASTGVKDPAYPDTRYVDELVVAGSVNTMPEKTLDAVADHGAVRGDTVTGTQDASAALLDRIEALGISIDEVTEQLEVEGLEKFEASWSELLGTVEAGLTSAASSTEEAR
ncbi:MAG: transaldolase [Cellulomonas iranensis]|jgi:transaldolase|uniref:Transaldolase n=1 Tax=Cellulomonas iranensis TaxID=76862 RepID=A0ABU0GNI5_9CELL|nr:MULTISPECIES: transaldolase [Cellulomonas]MBO9567458.1 transaldolase [Cellulomonas iranensis]MDQ0426934.1 transaldolase [Cellulomonas iranensis]TFH69417.1 transaldolase [Cellulomonas sp. HD19AZ1]